ncbi:hypothetical protein KM043_007788 [Ampulex compressa]|nr:hypothetical protein KM043_007788 [Ampulex compressa]
MRDLGTTLLALLLAGGEEARCQGGPKTPDLRDSRRTGPLQREAVTGRQGQWRDVVAATLSISLALSFQAPRLLVEEEARGRRMASLGEAERMARLYAEFATESTATLNHNQPAR